jgi:hypothetical protein
MIFQKEIYSEHKEFMKKYLSDDNPELWEKLRGHLLNKDPNDVESLDDLFCVKCGKKAVIRSDLRYVCPELYHLENCYFQ